VTVVFFRSTEAVADEICCALVVLFSGNNDYLADTDDIQTLSSALQAGKWLLKHYTVNFAHMDFVYVRTTMRQTNTHAFFL
jgi:hypothetical protein